MSYLPSELDEKGKPCPFCQENTITKLLSSNIKEYFDITYENKLLELKKLLSDYEDIINLIKSKDDYFNHPLITESKSEFETKYDKFYMLVISNRNLINDKIKSPAKKISLKDTSKALEQLNDFITEIKGKIKVHNEKMDNKNESISQLKDLFWEIMRWDYDQTITIYQKESTELQSKLKVIEKELLVINNSIKEQEEIIKKEQKNTVNIEDAIISINGGLLELGIDDFEIKKYSESFYRIHREGQTEDTFQTLSEGEKMVISFLYFLELCKGKKNASDVGQKKIIVIDDPISSLSHIFVFNIGQLIKKEFLLSDKYVQIFVLTHSLYFFYELTDPNHKRRKENQKLFRLVKNSAGSHFADMKYEEIQNDYHSYWHIIKDDKQPPALIANCMRNIIEYFFNFIEKKDLNNVFQKPVLQDVKYQAFCRYINRESHSLGQNIFDYKEFDYDNFKTALGLVFDASGYSEHYKEMMK